MRITSIAVLAITLVTSLFAGGGGASSIHLWSGGPKAAKKLMKAAKVIPEGTYTLRNGDGKYATFFSAGDDVQMWPIGQGHPDLGERATWFTIRQHPVKVKGYRALQSVHVFNHAGLEKCLTASWGSVADTFGVFDMCRVDLLKRVNLGHKPHINSAHGNLQNDKQLFVFVPAGGKDTYHIVAAAHIEDMKTRCLFGQHIQGRGAMGYYRGLELNDCTQRDNPGFHWTIKRVAGPNVLEAAPPSNANATSSTA